MRQKYKKETKRYIKDSQDRDFNFIGKDRKKMDRLTKKFHFKELKKKAYYYYNKDKELFKIKDEYVKLDVPIHVGFIKYFIINPEVIEKLRNTNRLETVKTLLNRLNNTIFSKNRNFLVKKRSKNRFKYKKESPKLRHLFAREYMELPDDQKYYFTQTSYYNRYTKSLYNVYVFNRMEFLQEKIAPYFITHKKVVDTDLESERSFIEDKFWTRGNIYRPIIFYNEGYRDRYGDNPKDLRAYYTEKEFIDEVYNT